MRERLRPRDDEPADGNTGDVDGGELQAFRRAGEEFLAAGDDAIDRALSRNSSEFLRMSRQEGGQ